MEIDSDNEIIIVDHEITKIWSKHIVFAPEWQVLFVQNKTNS